MTLEMEVILAVFHRDKNGSIPTTMIDFITGR